MTDYILFDSEIACPIFADYTKYKLVESILKTAADKEEDSVVKEIINDFINYDLNNLIESI